MLVHQGKMAEYEVLEEYEVYGRVLVLMVVDGGKVYEIEIEGNVCERWIGHGCGGSSDGCWRRGDLDECDLDWHWGAGRDCCYSCSSSCYGSGISET